MNPVIISQRLEDGRWVEIYTDGNMSHPYTTPGMLRCWLHDRNELISNGTGIMNVMRYWLAPVPESGDKK